MSKNSGLNFPGTYRIRNVINDKSYVGQARNIRERWQTHLRGLKRGLHPNCYLQRAWDKYGAENFVFEVIENLSYLSGPELHAALDEAEIQLLMKLGEDGYNLMLAVEHGVYACAETSAKLTIAHTKMWADPVLRGRIVASMVASYDEELRKQRSEVSKAYNTPEVRAATAERTRLLWQNPIHWTTQSERRKANWQNPEYVAKQYKARVAVWKDPEVRDKRIEGMTKAANDPIIKAKRATASKKTWAEKKARGETKWSEERKAAHSRILREKGAARKRAANPDFAKNLSEGARRGWIKRRAGLAEG